MKFSEAKALFKPGDIIAVSHKEWATLSDLESQIVRVMTESEYSHTCTVWENNGEPTVIEAVVPSVCINPLSKYLDNGFYWLQTSDKPMNEAEQQYGLAALNEPYSKLEAVLGDLDLIRLGADQLWYCSELVVCMRRLSGLDLGPHAVPAAVVQKALSMGYQLTFVTKD
jgi:hypothetical protein